MENFAALIQEPYVIRALLASSMVGLMCGLLGCFIVLRNMALIGDALAHAILPGVVVAFVLVGYSTICLLYTSPSPRDQRGSRMPSSA